MKPQHSSVSIVIPCYNQAHFLGEAIESALAQTHPDCEIVVVDDGSPDNTAEVVARYPGVRYFRQPNQGLGAARNAGLRESAGDFIVFMDADDRLLPHALSTNLEFFRQHPECAYVAGLTRYMTHGGELLPTLFTRRAEKEHYRELLYRNATPGIHCIMFRRAIFDAVGGFSTRAGIKGAEDYDLYLRLARKFPIRYHNIVIAEYRLNAAGMSRDPALMLRSTLSVLRSQRKHIKGSKADKQAYRLGMRNWQLYYGDLTVSHIRLSVRKRHWRQALRDSWALLRGNPRGLVRHAYRKTYRTIFRIESEPEQTILSKNQFY